MQDTDDRRVALPFPLTTGAAAQLLGTTEPRLAETVRRGRVSPAPTVAAGRRLWNRDQVLQAAEALGLLDDACRERIALAFGTSSHGAVEQGGSR